MGFIRKYLYETMGKGLDLAPLGDIAPNPTRLLRAICKVESAGGDPRHAMRYEEGFYGRYIAKSSSSIVLDLYLRHGKELATSWGCMQVMGLVAYELPEDPLPKDIGPNALLDPRLCMYFAVQLINCRCIPSAVLAIHRGLHPRTEPGAVAAIADAYNSGSAIDRMRPEGYIAKVLAAYEEAE